VTDVSSPRPPGLCGQCRMAGGAQGDPRRGQPRAMAEGPAPRPPPEAETL